MARRLSFDRVLFATVLLLVGLGLVMVYSASMVFARGDTVINPLFLRQSMAACLGIIAMLIAMYVDYRLLAKPLVVYGALVLVMILLASVLFTPSLNNTHRWFFIGGLSFQPSELAKLVLVLFLADQVGRKRDRLNTRAALLPCTVVTALMAVLVFLGGDLGSTILLLVPAVAITFLAGLSLKLMAVSSMAVAPLLIGGALVAPYRLRRLMAFLNPEADPHGDGYQVLQSLIAVGSGGLTGLGPGNSLQKLHYLPSPHADFIFAIISEELGFIGATLVVMLFGLVLWRGVLAGLHAPDDFGRYLAWGFTSLVVVQALVHLSVVLGLLPTTGVPLPLVSHGGSALVATMAACGVILNVSQHA